MYLLTWQEKKPIQLSLSFQKLIYLFFASFPHLMPILFTAWYALLKRDVKMADEVVRFDIILQYLLLNQALTKRELARTVRVSVYKINKVLANYQLASMLKEEQKLRLCHLYHRLKLYEAQIEDYMLPLSFFLRGR